MAKLDKTTFIEALKEMTILEIKELVDAMKEEFGIDPTAVAAAPAQGAAVEQGPAEQTEFTVELTEVGQGKIAVIKAVREVTGLDLKGAKELVDAAPKAVKEKVSEAEAQEIKAKLEEAGATVTIK